MAELTGVSGAEGDPWFVFSEAGCPLWANTFDPGKGG